MRKVIDFTVENDGRDKGKTFVITEMSSTDTFDWAAQLIFAAMNAGANIPQDIADAGIAGILSMGFRGFALVPHEKAKPLMDRLMRCVQIRPSRDVTRDLMEGDVEEADTLAILHARVWGLHADRFMKGVLSTSAPRQSETRAS